MLNFIRTSFVYFFFHITLMFSFIQSNISLNFSITQTKFWIKLRSYSHVAVEIHNRTQKNFDKWKTSYTKQMSFFSLMMWVWNKSFTYFLFSSEFSLLLIRARKWNGLYVFQRKILHWEKVALSFLGKDGFMTSIFAG